MSKLADKLKNIYKTAAPTLGFRKPTEEEAEMPPLLLIADLTRTASKKPKNIGAHAAIVNSENTDAGSFKELAASIPLGLLLDKNTDQEKIQELINAGCDFVVFGLETPLESVSKEGLGRVLKIEPSLAPGLIRAINELSLSIDAVLIAGNNPAVNIDLLLTCQFFAGSVNKPLLLNVKASLTDNELSSLHETGIKGLIFPEGTPLKVFDAMKKTISNLPKSVNRKTKTSVFLPRVSAQPETRVEEEEDGEEEEGI